MAIDERFARIHQNGIDYQVLKYDPETGEPYDWDEAATFALVQETDFFQQPVPATDDPPPVPVPAEIQMWQARVILARVGLLDAVNAAVEASDNAEIHIAWEYAPNVVRRSIFVTSMAGALDLTDATIDSLFIEGAKIK